MLHLSLPFSMCMFAWILCIGDNGIFGGLCETYKIPAYKCVKLSESSFDVIDMFPLGI